MNIAIIGYGKMGKAIERIALSRGHSIVAIIDLHNQADIHTDRFRSAHVAIEFTNPHSAPTCIKTAASEGIPVVSGSTGWADSLPDVTAHITACGGTLLASSNFSLGVNIFFALNRRLAAMMHSAKTYRPSMVETHHIHKLDHPSGTAITLAQGIMAADPDITAWQEPAPSPTEPHTLGITSLRQGEVPGIHTITWDSDTDAITITHSAKSRDGFALGAVMAAEWAAKQKGILTMEQMLTDLKLI